MHPDSPRPARLPASVKLFLAAAVLVLVILAGRRHFAERADRTVEAAISWKDTKDLAEKERLRSGQADIQPWLETFLERCRLMGIRSVSIPEQTLDNLRESGEALAFEPADAEKLKALGLGVGVGDFLDPRLLWVRKNPPLVARVQEAVKSLSSQTQAHLKTRKASDYTALENQLFAWHEKPAMFVGWDPASMRTLERIGLAAAYSLELPGKWAFPESIHIGTYSSVQSAWILTGALTESAARNLQAPDRFAASLRDRPGKLVLLESVNAHLVGALARQLDLRRAVIRGHTIPPDEMKSLSRGAMAERWRRAVKERSCRFLYFRWNPDWTPDENLALARETLQTLRADGFSFEKRQRAAERWVEWPARKLRLLLAFAAAVLGPLAALFWLARNSDASEHADAVKILNLWAGSCVIALASGLAISALLPDSVFANGLEVFRGVKLSLVLPFVLAGCVLYPPAQLLRLAQRPVRLVDALLLGLALAALQIALQRSGNFASNPHAYELGLRSALENWLGVRPRLKEFLIGHPLLILGVALWTSREGSPGRALGRPLVWAGALAWISIVNTFCHLHTPVWISALRTAYGMALGALIGLALVALWKRFAPRVAPLWNPAAPPHA